MDFNQILSQKFDLIFDKSEKVKAVFESDSQLIDLLISCAYSVLWIVVISYNRSENCQAVLADGHRRRRCRTKVINKHSTFPSDKKNLGNVSIDFLTENLIQLKRIYRSLLQPRKIKNTKNHFKMKFLAWTYPTHSGF